MRLAGGARRWPDLVLDRAQSRDAVELEFAAKTSERLARILDGYLHADYARVFLYVETPALGRRLAALAERRSTQARGASRRPEAVPRLIVDAWPGLPEETRAEIRRAIAQAR